VTQVVMKLSSDVQGSDLLLRAKLLALRLLQVLHLFFAGDGASLISKCYEMSNVETQKVLVSAILEEV